MKDTGRLKTGDEEGLNVTVGLLTFFFLIKRDNKFFKTLILYKLPITSVSALMKEDY